jgi:hypothetical protein
MECCEGVEVIHGEELRRIVVAHTANPLEATCPPETGKHELFPMVIVAPS